MIKNRKTFVVTGGTGFIGSGISKLLIDKQYNVRIFDNNLDSSFFIKNDSLLEKIEG